jgi:hypothetical protein
VLVSLPQETPASIQLTVVNSTPTAIVLISPDRPSFIFDPKKCVATFSSVVNSDDPDFDFTPTLIPVDAGGMWSGVAVIPGGVPRGRPRPCKHCSTQVKLAFILGPLASGAKLSREEIIEREEVMTSEEFQFTTRSNYGLQPTVGAPSIWASRTIPTLRAAGS